MEQEGSLDFKALRAKFQEEAALKQMKNKPAIPEKPKLIPPPGARVSLLSSINTAVENKMPIMPRVVFKEAKPEPEAKRPPSIPPSLKSKDPVRDSNFNTELLDHQQKKEGDVVKQAFKDGKLPLVLPVPPKVEKSDPTPPAKSLPAKKKAFLPFKSKTSKPGKESPETNEGPASTNSVLKPPAAAAEVTVVDGPNLQNGNLPHEVVLSSEPQSPNSERAETPPSADEKAEETSTGSRTPPCDQRVLNALEKAKRKFSPIHSLSRPKSASPVNGDQSHGETPSQLCPELPPIDYEDPMGDIPSKPPTAINQSTEASVLPDEINGPSPRQSSPALEGSIETGTGDIQPGLQAIISPPRKPLPDLESLGPSPEKPPRPPFVDLSSYQTTASEAHVENALKVTSLENLVLDAPEFDATECEAVEFEAPQLQVPEIPDFETSEFETHVNEAPEEVTPNVGEFGAVDLGTSVVVPADLGPPDPGAQDLGALNHEVLGVELLDQGAPDVDATHVEVPQFGVVELGNPEFEIPKMETPEPEAPGTVVTESLPTSPDSSVNKESEAQPGLRQEESHYESCDNVYEDVETVSKFRRGQNTRKRKGPPKNPYADSQPVNEESHKTSWFFNSRNERKASPEAHDDKEQKKKEKQRLEKEKKEQKEREKKENEMKKKFKITGQEEPMYQARVTIASKGRKNDLPLKSGDVVSIIRTTNCPKGKWLARDSNNKYGYISVKNVELDIKEMLELGKKATQAAGRNTATEGETVSLGSRSSNHYPLSTGSFSDDSEEWTCDDDDTLSPTENKGHSRTVSMPEMLCQDTDVEHTFSDGTVEDSNAQARHEALQKLATFFQQQRETAEIVAESNTTEITEEEPSLLYPVEEPAYLAEQEEDLQLPDMEILPPPELYADSVDDGAVQASLS